MDKEDFIELRSRAARDDGNHKDSSSTTVDAATTTTGNDKSNGSVADEAVHNQTRTRRLFSMSQLFAFSLTYMGTWEGWNVNMTSALLNGGPRALFFGAFLALAGAWAQASSVAEMASLQPVAGAQYHWTYHLAPGAIANSVVIQLEALIAFNHPDYVPGGWHTSAMVIALCVAEGLLNLFAFKLVPWVEMTGGVLHVAMFIVFIILFPVMGTRHNSDILFFDSTASGWADQPGVSWNLGMITLTWALTGFDSAIHMSEETKQAKSAVPRAIFWSIFMNSLMGLVYISVFLIAMGPVEDSPQATTALYSLYWFNGIASNLASIASVSRLTWAWSRDGGLPIYFSYIDPKLRVPARALCLTVVLVSLLCLLNIGGTTYIVFGAITGLTCWALYFSYAICLVSMISARFNKADLKLGSWNLGRFGLAINCFALVYTLYIMVWLPFPQSTPVDAAGMNYCAPMVGFVLIFTLGMWFGWAKKNWSGPNVKIRDFVIAQSS
ncbi:7-keto 8-aminopelargonic acid transporter [Apiospora phragmitis]|uniref:7-keto 8-aminopelargonic acid transporter n=1 Tax=Apiospora phragmitis TaxID=2905665 RepID=A0ABR1SVK5_9PEZI